MELQQKVLDHGFVVLRNISGPSSRIGLKRDAAGDYQPYGFSVDDTDPANVARISFDNLDKERTRAQDLALCDYLLKNWHTSPFEMIQVWLEMKMPIFVARQMVRYRMQAINEVSGRYAILPAEWYIPETVGGKSKDKKQGQDDNLGNWEQGQFKALLNMHCESGYTLYTRSIEVGVAPEHARMFLSLNHYTHWISSVNLHNLMHQLNQRLHGHAQIETRAYALAIYDLLKQQLPDLMALFDKHRRYQGHIDRLLTELVGEKKLKQLGNEAAAELALSALHTINRG